MGTPVFQCYPVFAIHINQRRVLGRRISHRKGARDNPFSMPTRVTECPPCAVVPTTSTHCTSSSVKVVPSKYLRCSLDAKTNLFLNSRSNHLLQQCGARVAAVSPLMTTTERTQRGQRDNIVAQELSTLMVLLRAEQETTAEGAASECPPHRRPLCPQFRRRLGRASVAHDLLHSWHLTHSIKGHALGSRRRRTYRRHALEANILLCFVCFDALDLLWRTIERVCIVHLSTWGQHWS